MYVLEVTRPYDSKADFALFTKRSGSMKVSRYRAVIDRFEAMAPRLQAVVVPFAIGVRGSFDESAWTQQLVNLDLAQAGLPRLFERVVTSDHRVVRALHCV